MLEGAFSFQAGARPIEQRPKYRNDSRGNDGPYMITVDPRVCRGSTYTKHKMQQETIKTQKPRQKLTSPRNRDISFQSTSYDIPQPKENRIDLEIQTEPYLQEVEEKPVEVNMETQTDAFLDRPPTPPYVPPKNGIDIEIQVDEADLFDFDFEVQPIVSTIVGKTLEQAFLEVNEEEELANIRRHKEAIEHQRNVELADVQRLEEAERRKFEEKQRRIEERLKIESEQADLRAKVAARGYGEFFVSDIMGDAISLLERRGYFYDEVEKEIDTTFMPWLEKAMEEASETRVLTDSIEQKVHDVTLELENEQMTKFEIDINFAADQKSSKEFSVMRKMLIEDLAAQKIRKALEGKRKAEQDAHKEEESEA